MPRRQNQKKKPSPLVRAANAELSTVRLNRVKSIVFPSLEQFVTTTLVNSDLSPNVIRSIMPYGPTNTNFVRSKQRYQLGTITQVVGAPTYQANYFAASSAPGFSDFAAAFDVYKIEAVAIEFSPQVMSNIYAANVMPRLYTAIDYDDSAAPTSIAQLLAYDTCQVAPACGGLVRTFVPRIAGAVYGGSAFTSFGNEAPQWIDAASPGVAHYGIKFALEGAIAAQTVLQTYDIDVTLYMAFKVSR